MSKENRIVCAAIARDVINPDGSLQFRRIVTGVRHWDSIMHQAVDFINKEVGNPNYMKHAIQGFVDKNGDFHTRKEAMVIASFVGQVEPKDSISNDGEFKDLYSEDLY